MTSGESGDGNPDEEAARIAAFRDSLKWPTGSEPAVIVGSTGGDGEDLWAEQHPTLERGCVLVANMEEFSKDAGLFGKGMRDWKAYGLEGPVRPDWSPDHTAQMLPVVLVTEHKPGGPSKGVLMDRRTGVLLGDLINVDEGFAHFAIQPLYFGGNVDSNSLTMMHVEEDIPDSEPMMNGLCIGGWERVKVMVAEGQVSPVAFKFSIQHCLWASGELEEQVQRGAWTVASVSSDVLMKDRSPDGSGKITKPIWREIRELIGGDSVEALKEVYGEEL